MTPTLVETSKCRISWCREEQRPGWTLCPGHGALWSLRTTDHWATWIAQQEKRVFERMLQHIANNCPELLR